MPEAPDISSTTETLVTALDNGGFHYAIIGGVAVILNGYNRTTQDVDAVVWDLDERLDELAQVLASAGFVFRVPNGKASAREIRVLRLVSAGGVEVDLSMGLLPFEDEVITRADSMTTPNGIVAKVATVEDLIIMKLVASRDRDLDDVTRLLELYPDQNRDRIWNTVEDYAEILENPEIARNLRARIPLP